MDNSILDGLARALADRCSLEAIRAIEAGADPEPLWCLVEELGFLDAFVDESSGGVGLPLANAFAIGHLLGSAAFPLPMLETMLARALLSCAGIAAPDGPIVLADALPAAIRGIGVGEVPGMRVASHLLLRHESHWHLHAIEPAAVRAGAYRPNVSGAIDEVDANAALARFAAPHSAATLVAPLHAIEMAGSMDAVLSMTVNYANDRRQFGRPIGQFQAMQQELSVLAEQVVLAQMAARLGVVSAAPNAPDALRGASAKLDASEAARRAVAIAHGVHGAIGITEEYALGIHSRRLHEWRSASPTAGACARAIGTAAFAHRGNLLDFVLEAMPAA